MIQQWKLSTSPLFLTYCYGQIQSLTSLFSVPLQQPYCTWNCCPLLPIQCRNPHMDWSQHSWLCAVPLGIGKSYRWQGAWSDDTANCPCTARTVSRWPWKKWKLSGCIFPNIFPLFLGRSCNVEWISPILSKGPGHLTPLAIAVSAMYNDTHAYH